MRPRSFAAGLLAAAVLALAFAGCGSGGPSSSRHAQTKATVIVSRATFGRPIPSGFTGLSVEPKGLETYAGTNPGAPNPVFEQLLRNLAGGAHTGLRVGGDGTDWTWWPVSSVAQPGGVKFSLSGAWMGVARAVAQSTGARLIVGVNLEADSATLAAAEAQALVNGIGSRSIEGLELGNEPELYGSFSWYKAPDGQHVFGRPRTYDFAAYLQDFSAITQALPDVPLAGPSTGAPKWIPRLGEFLSAEPRVAVATIHRYPLKHCKPTSHVTMGQLLSPGASRGLANGIAPYVAVARAHHVPLRIDELNAISCGGQRGVSDTFGSALWAADTLFELARVGVDGVNFHTVPRTINELISADYSRGRWHSLVHPQYYGMMMFAQAAPAGSRLLRITGSGGPGVHIWATRAPDGRVRVMLVNESTAHGARITMRIAGAAGPGRLERLQAPSVTAKSGVTLGGQSFGTATYTGRLAGNPSDTTAPPSGGAYSVIVPAGSGALLTLRGAR